MKSQPIQQFLIIVTTVTVVGGAPYMHILMACPVGMLKGSFGLN